MATKSSVYRPLALLVWCGLFAAVIYGMWVRKNSNNRGGAESIASVSSHTGTVKVRAHRRVSWKEVGSAEKLFEGDRLSTDLSSEAEVLFSEGRAIKVGANSLILITAIKEGGDYNFIVDVQKGSVVGIMTAKKKNSSSSPAVLPLQLVVGKKSATVDHGQQVQVNFGNGTAPTIVETKLTLKEASLPVTKLVKKIIPLPTVIAVNPDAPPKTDLSAISTAAAGLSSIAPKDIPLPDAQLNLPEAPKPKEAVKIQLKTAALPMARDFLPILVSPIDGTVLWSLKPLQEMALTPLKFSIAPPRGKLKGTSWEPLLEIGATGSGQHSDGLVLSGSGYRQQTIETTFGVLAKRGVVASAGGIPQVTINFREGVAIKGIGSKKDGEAKTDTDTEKAFAKSSKSLKVLALGDVSTGGIAFSVDRLVNDKSPIPDSFLDPKRPISASSPFLSVRLSLASDLKDLLGFVRGADAVEFSRTPLSDGVGIYVVRSQQIVAQLAGTLVPSKQALADLLSSIKGDFIYKGDKKAFIDATARGGKSLKEIAGTMIDRGQVFYVMSAKDLVAVNRDFVSRNGDVARFIENNASVIFTSQVEVLEARP